MPRTKGAKTGVFGNNINKEQFEELCRMMCTQEEICGFFKVYEDTLDRFVKQNYGEEYTFLRIYPQLTAGGKISLRRTQFRLAENNPNMAIFLGKQYLGQKDVVEEKVEERIAVVNDVPEED